VTIVVGGLMTMPDATYSVRRLTVEVPGVREFQRRYEQAVPPNPAGDLASLIKRNANWPEVLDCIAESAPHGFLVYWRNEVSRAMKLAGDDAECVAYLMGNVTIAEQMFRYEPRAMLYAPLRTVIWEDVEGGSWFTVDQPSTQLASFRLAEVSAVGVELDRKVAALLEALGVEVPRALLSS
jgi:uncharacterized protein (DUF302 family)